MFDVTNLEGAPSFLITLLGTTFIILNKKEVFFLLLAIYSTFVCISGLYDTRVLNVLTPGCRNR